MSGKRADGERNVSRRAVLGTAAGIGAALSSGCVGAFQNFLNGGGPGQLSLTVKAVPADSDAIATQIARQLVNRMQAIGINARFELEARTELRKDVLMNNNYDIYVDEFPVRNGPDMMRPMLQSVFTSESGWQNPFDYTNLTVDEQLDTQRATTGSDRELAVDAVQRKVAREQPLGVIAFPTEIWTARDDRYTGWDAFPPTNPLAFIALTDDGSANDRLRVTTTDGTPTENLNPLSVVQRYRGTFTDLLYDPLARRYDGDVNPWLAEDWNIDRTDGTTTATVTLRSGLRWHDGQPLTARDVAFTFRFLNDTTLETGDAEVPAPRLRGRASLVESADDQNTRTVELQFGDTSPAVVERALTVPILPKHVWEATTDRASAAGLDMTPYPTEAIITDNSEPVGSGVLQFEAATSGESLVLTRFDDHFLHRDTTTDPATYFDGGVPFSRLSVRIVPSDAAAVELVAADEADATAMSVAPDEVSRINGHDSLELYTAESRSFYHVGFNTRRVPLGNGHFRRLLMRLLDKEHIVEETMDGYATPGVTPLTGTDWVPADLTWRGRDPQVPFIGEGNSLNTEQARELFKRAGFKYDESGAMIDR
ncbi:ABC transporter substrate-binding protein [Salinibaculum rarum]|uniref:ABC transporter substrate-binding protein n=1 Tax=Salinibaculum rarum TaxID=3058903 RepID=UPI00265E3D8B|nr:ABC transporter substrate-binding protein [Salinibaculum sp. KK48]